MRRRRLAPQHFVITGAPVATDAATTARHRPAMDFLIKVKAPYPDTALLDYAKERTRLIRFVAGAPEGIADAASLCTLSSTPVSFSSNTHLTGIAMRTYYFDIKDGIPTRDRQGIEFSSVAGAIEHSKELALRLRSDNRLGDPGLAVVVVDESGAEIHREPVYPDVAGPAVSLGRSAGLGKRG